MIEYLSAESIVSFHDLIINKSGGLCGLKNSAALMSCVECPKMMFDGKSLYPTLAEKAAALLFFLVKNHPFHDGNKRTAAMSSALFLKRNGVDIGGPQKVEELVVDVACNKKTLKECAEYFKSLIQNEKR